VLRELLEWTIFLPVRFRRGRRSKRNNQVRRNAIESVQRSLAPARNIKAEASQTVCNVALYVLLLDDDLSEFTDDMVFARGDRRRRFIAKHEAILLYEAAEDLPQLLGKKFRVAVNDLGPL
jgi:hypothetical protein